MGRTEYTHLQYMYTTDIPLLPLWIVGTIQSLKAVQYSYTFALLWDVWALHNIRSCKLS